MGGEVEPPSTPIRLSLVGVLRQGSILSVYSYINTQASTGYCVSPSYTPPRVTVDTISASPPLSPLIYLQSAVGVIPPLIQR